MMRVCCQCNNVLGEVPPYSDYRVTHGYCQKCEQKMTDEIDNE